MQIFCCSDIPLQNLTKTLSGGEKLRINLVRAFNLGEIIIINSNLDSLDEKMKQKIIKNMQLLVAGKIQGIQTKFTIFIKGNKGIVL
jgi:ABC-type molybdate transport system ATPase subunit